MFLDTMKVMHPISSPNKKLLIHRKYNMLILVIHTVIIIEKVQDALLNLFNLRNSQDIPGLRHFIKMICSMLMFFLIRPRPHNQRIIVQSAVSIQQNCFQYLFNTVFCGFTLVEISKSLNMLELISLSSEPFSKPQIIEALVHFPNFHSPFCTVVSIPSCQTIRHFILNLFFCQDLVETVLPDFFLLRK